MAKAPPVPTNVPANYEVALTELEQLLARLESGELPLDQLLSGYQRGASLLSFCRERLEAVEGQIKVLDQGALKTWTAE
jgi:exodeoxyribonuclease VII small subunit